MVELLKAWMAALGNRIAVFGAQWALQCTATPTQHTPIRGFLWWQDYNTAADRLQLIPVTAKRAGGVQFELKMQRGGQTAAELVNVDLKVSPP